MGTVACNLDELSPIPALRRERHEASLIRQILTGKDSPFEVCERSQTAGLLQVALADLPEKYRQVIRMRDLAGCGKTSRAA
jgi:DNA-directed RNA polymerase specialized sigma24 family protein